MTQRVAINGFGRIGRAVLRAGWGRPGITFVHVNDLTSPEMLAHLLVHDTVHGRWPHDVRAVDGGFTIDGVFLPVTAEKDPAALPWAAEKVDVVLECTGVFNSKAKASKHLTAGARKVLLSAPGDEVDGTFVVGVNDHELGPEHVVVSNASCTTNCLAPLAKVLHETFGIEHGVMTTVHAYTMDQNLLDAPHKKDFRRARAAAQNMVPTSTGAAKAIGLVLPALAGKLHGMAIRVPVPNGSLVDLTVHLSRDVTKAEVNAALKAAAEGPLAGILEYTEAPLVSSDIVGNPSSSIIDGASTMVQGGHMLKVMSWYDNEWGFSNRMLDLLARLGEIA
jgi:glyceraldehyde 3-phosphate dehydrogenase